MKCTACPFLDGETEEATIGQNYGCLPTKHDMIKIFDNTGVALSCHENDEKPCSGLCGVRKSASDAVVLAYSEWYLNGY